MIVSPNNEALLAKCLESLAGQRGQAVTEVIVVSNDWGAGAAVAARFPGVRHVSTPRGTTVPAMRAIGIRQSTGEIVALAEDHGYFGDGWVSAMVAAHDEGHAIVGGAVENDSGQRALDWAVYFYDYGRYMLPQGAGVLPGLSGNNVSYRRSLLEREQESLRNGLYEAFLHERLKGEGHALYFTPSAIVFHNKHYMFGTALTQCFHFGRSYGGMRVAGAPATKRVLYAAASLGLPILLPLRIALRTLRRKRHRLQLLRAFPYLAALMCGWAAGELVGYLSGEGDSARHWA